MTDVTRLLENAVEATDIVQKFVLLLVKHVVWKKNIWNKTYNKKKKLKEKKKKEKKRKKRGKNVNATSGDGVDYFQM